LIATNHPNYQADFDGWRSAFWGSEIALSFKIHYFGKTNLEGLRVLS